MVALVKDQTYQFNTYMCVFAVKYTDPWGIAIIAPYYIIVIFNLKHICKGTLLYLSVSH